MNSDTLKGLQALRGLAALSVMFFHFRWNINDVWPGMGDKLFGWGATGVDLFFLISGFVITLTAKKSAPDFTGSFNFLKRRALRIAPAYYIIFLITFFLSGAMSTFHYPDKTQNFISALFFQPIYPDHGPFYVDDSGMYGIRWSLNYEIYFYLIIGILMITPFRWLTTCLYFSLTLVGLPIMAEKGFSFSAEGYHTDSAFFGLITNPIIFLFLAGMLVGHTYPIIKRLNGTIMSILLICSLALAFVMFCDGRFISHGLLSSGWIYLLIMIFTIGSEKKIGKFTPSFLVRLGDISFSLYLVHTLMNAGIGKRLEKFGIENGPERFFLSCVLSLVLAWLSWRFIEAPFLNKKKHNAKKSESTGPTF
ncbi:acyltransferase family protein [Erwinia sp. OPT-41]|uniref:Acyltransferase family protein n=1 Tax=Erwinia plantamica TaxID=3237104 RepID=A0ABW7CL44_9GAMM